MDDSSNVVEGEAAHVEYAKWICETKRAFQTHDDAKKAAAVSINLDVRLKALYAYRCPACGLLHLTKRRLGKPLASRAGRP